MKLARLPVGISERLVNMTETGMGYQVMRVTTRSGAVFNGVVVIDCTLIGSVDRNEEVPFDPDDIVSFELTHDRNAVVR